MLGSARFAGRAAGPIYDRVGVAELSVRGLLLRRGFLSLLVTQFLGAANDNLLKGLLTYMVIDGTWAGRLGTGGQGIVGLCFTIPFILLSGYAGRFADRHSKRYVSVLVKVVEIPIAILGLIAFCIGNLWVALAALVALTGQSAYFGPAKYGMIPELVPEGDLSRANGAINMFTNLAVILGTLASGIIADRYDPLPDAEGLRADPVTWLPGAALIVVALAGLGSVLFLPKLPPGDRSLRREWNPFGTYVRSLREMSRGSLLLIALAWSYFYLLAGLGLLIIPEYTIVLAVSREMASRLLGILAIAIGLGCGAAGLVSGHRIEPRLAPIGAAGISVFFVLLGTVPPTFGNVGWFLFGAGFFAGFYLIPFQALLQKLSPDSERGQFLGTANALSFLFLSLASILYVAIRPAFGGAPQGIFLVCAALMAVGGAAFMVRLKRYVFRPRA